MVKRWLTIFLIAFLFAALTRPLLASEIILNLPVSGVNGGDQFTVDVLLDPHGNSVNASSGNLVFPSDMFDVIGIYERDSVLSLWVEKPHLRDSGDIVWSGIIPGGFLGVLTPDSVERSPGHIFSVAFKAKKSGGVNIRIDNAVVFLNDGIGSRDEVNIVLKNTPIATVAADKNPPEPFVPVVAHDPNVFDGSWFVAFFTQDKETGVNRYSVFETRSSVNAVPENRWVNAESPYHLTDQSLRSYVYVRAVDNTGNERIAVVAPAHGAYTVNDILVAFAILIAMGAITFLLFRLSRKKLKR